MGLVTSIIARQQDHANLRRHNGQVCATIDLRPQGFKPHGAWAILGRVVIRNDDGDTQPISAQLISDGHVIDQVAFRLAEGESACVHLQGNFDVINLVPALDHSFKVTLVCSTFHGEALEGSLLAISVDSTLNT